MQTFLYSDPKIKYLGRFLQPDGGMTSAWQGSQIRMKIKNTTQVILTFDVRDLVTDAGCFISLHLDNSLNGTLYYLASVLEAFTGERSTTISIPNLDEHLITFKMSANSPISQFGQIAMIKFKSLQIDDTGTLEDYTLPGRRILCIGDSWMGGENDWPRLMSNRFNIYPVAYGGATSAALNEQYAYQANGVLMYGDPDIDAAIISFGVNDLLSGLTRDQFKIYVKELIAQIRTTVSGPIFLVQIPRNLTTGQQFDQYGDYMLLISQELSNVFYIETMSAVNSFSWSDNYHLDGSGKQAFASFVENKMMHLFYGVFNYELRAFLQGAIIKVQLTSSTPDDGIFVAVTNGEGVAYAKLVDPADNRASVILIYTDVGIMAMQGMTS